MAQRYKFSIESKSFPLDISGEPFKGVIGRVARWQGQQRVGVCIEEIGTIATAYIPNAFIEIVKK